MRDKLKQRATHAMVSTLMKKNAILGKRLEDEICDRIIGEILFEEKIAKLEAKVSQLESTAKQAQQS